MHQLVESDAPSKDVAAAGSSASTTRRLQWMLASVAVLYAVLQFALLDQGRALDWDEAEYLAEVAAGVQADHFDVHRARGIVLLVAPPAALGVPLIGIRIYLGLVSAALLFVAFRPWTRHVGLAAVLAAALFATTWLTIFYGSEISPNLFVAFAAVAAAGYFLQAQQAGWTSRSLLSSVAAMVCVALLRPTDALWVGAGLVLAVVVQQRRVALRPVIAIGAGVALGWLPWIIEAFTRFGGPIQRLRLASKYLQNGVHAFGGAGVLPAFEQHLALTDGRLIGPESPVVIPTGGVIWWSAMTVLTVYAIWRARRSARPTGLTVAAVTALVFALPYLVVVGTLAPRFLLPTYALASIPVAAGLLFVASSTRLPRVIGSGLVAAVVVAWTVWGVRVLNAEEKLALDPRETLQRVGEAVADINGERPCSLVAEVGHPQIAFTSGCRAARFALSDTVWPKDVSGERVDYALALTELPPESPVSEWERIPLGDAFPPGWMVYVAPGVEVNSSAYGEPVQQE